LAGCTTTSQRIGDAAATEVNAGQVAGALAATRDMPSMPAYCHQKSLSGVEDGDRLDVALVKTDAALTRANDRSRFCWQWYEDQRMDKGK
jgi:hypothetical protein